MSAKKKFRPPNSRRKPRPKASASKVFAQPLRAGRPPQAHPVEASVPEHELTGFDWGTMSLAGQETEATPTTASLLSFWRFG